LEWSEEGAFELFATGLDSPSDKATVFGSIGEGDILGQTIFVDSMCLVVD